MHSRNKKTYESFWCFAIFAVSLHPVSKIKHKLRSEKEIIDIRLYVGYDAECRSSGLLFLCF